MKMFILILIGRKIVIFFTIFWVLYEKYFEFLKYNLNMGKFIIKTSLFPKIKKNSIFFS